MSDIMGVASRVYDYLKLYNPDLAGGLIIGQYFEISDSVYEAADQLTLDISSKSPLGFIPEGAQLPADPAFLWYRWMGDGLFSVQPSSFEPASSFEPVGISVILLSSFMPPLAIGSFVPGTTNSKVNGFETEITKRAGIDHQMRVDMVMTVASTLATINAPRITKRVVAGTRQSRRAAARKIGASTEQWHRVEWDLTKPKVERGERLGKGWHMPLHYTRGHWRRSEEGRGKAVLLPGKGWHTWVDGFWSGHPSYGIKRAVYAPRIGEKSAVRDRHAAFEGCEAAE
jgi:hypothetical protein